MGVNKALVLTEVPNGWPVPGQHLATKDIGFDLDAPAPQDGIVLEILYSSFDPYMRGRMRDANVKSYNAAFELGQPVDNFGIARVLKSATADFAEGDVVRGFLPIEQYLAVDGAVIPKRQIKKLDNPHGLDPRYFIGPLGMPGLTAFSSLYEIGKPKKGETIFISAASGAVGQIVGQLAKHEGLRVIGSVGSKEKLDFITKTLGFDGGFNYKEEKPADALSRLAPDGIDIYYENVGGEQLEAAIGAANDWARFVMCGQISNYSLKEGEAPYNVKNLFKIVSKRLKLQGFIVSDPEFGPKYSKEHNEKVASWIADGSFKVTIDETDGIDNAAEGLVGMLSGKNFGKAILKIKDP